MYESLILFFLLSLLAEILGTLGGFGSSLLFVPIAGFFFDFQTVLGITALFHLSSNLSKIVLFRNGIDRKLIIQMGIPAVLFVILGAFLTRFVNTKSLEIVLSLFLIVLSGGLLIFKQLVIRPNSRNSIIGGSLSGLAAGLLGTGGAIRGITLAAFNLEVEVFIATSAAIDMGIDLSRSVVYFSNGFVHNHDLYLIPVLLIIGMLGTWIGKKLLQRFTQQQFKSLALAMILLIGIISLIKFSGLFNR